MKTLAFYDTKPYDRIWFDRLKGPYGIEFRYFESHLNADTAALACGLDGAVAFVNDQIDAQTINALYDAGVTLLALRCSGYNNVDLKAAQNRIQVVRVPHYSPHSIAEHAMALLLTVNRKIHRAYIRTRDHNFSLNGLVGMDLHEKTAGIVGTGQIGQAFIRICHGFGMRVIGYDLYPSAQVPCEYVSLDRLFSESDVISLHCPLTPETYHMVDEQAFAKMKPDTFIINTSRGSLIDSEALLEAIKSEKIRGAGLDVYEEETDLFFEDVSERILQDDVLARLISMPNIVVTSHQAFLTDEALQNIAKQTLENIHAYFQGRPLFHEVRYEQKERTPLPAQKTPAMQP